MEKSETEIRNLYNVKVINKTFESKEIDLKVLSHPNASIFMPGEKLVAESESLTEGKLFIDLPKSDLDGKKTKLKIGVFSNGELLEKVKTNFIGPWKSLMPGPGQLCSYS